MIQWYEKTTYVYQFTVVSSSFLNIHYEMLQEYVFLFQI